MTSQESIDYSSLTREQMLALLNKKDETISNLEKETQSLNAALEEKEDNSSLSSSDDVGYIAQLRADIQVLEENTPIYPRQRQTALETYQSLSNPFNNITLVVAMMQSGKTGVMPELVRLFGLEEHENPIHPNNMYVITGLSSTEWVEQTQERLPRILKDNVLHRPTLEKLKEIKNKKNCLILMDETQVACKTSMSINKIFKMIGITGTNARAYLDKTNTKIVQFSATPNGTIYDLKNRLDIGVKIVKMHPGEGYKSCFDFQNEGRVLESFPLTNSTPKKKMRTLREHLIGNTPKYHFFRLKTQRGAYEREEGILRDNFPECDFVKYDGEHQMNINEKYLKHAPTKNIIILFKEMGRCAKTYIPDHIGVVFERHASNVQDDVVLQGFLGRVCGYNPEVRNQIIYTNINSLKNYENLWNSDFDEQIPWNSNSTIPARKTGDKTKPRPTYNRDLENNSSNNESHNEECNMEEFSTLDDAKCFIKQIKPKAQPGRALKINSDGFYYHKIRGEQKKIQSYDYIVANLGAGLKKNEQGTSYRLHPCYRDITDPNSLVFVVAYKE